MRTAYFCDEENREAFREEHAAMALHEREMGNALPVGASVAAAPLVVVALVVI